MDSTWTLVKRYAWIFILSGMVIAISFVLVATWKSRNPGATTHPPSQGMNLSVTVTQPSPVRVTTEVAHAGPFAARVSYAGSVAPLQEQVIYSRVEGWLTKLDMDSGDTVKPNQILAVVTAPDLQARVAEAAAGYTTATRGIPVAQADIERMKAEQAAALSDIESATGSLRRVEGMVSAAQKRVVQAQQSLASARADLDLSKAEAARAGNLYKAGAVSLQEYQAEQAKMTAAEAECSSQEAKLAEAEANATALDGDVTSSRAAVTAAKHRAAAAVASVAGSRQELYRSAAMASQAGAVANTARIISDYRYIRSPLAGTITKKNVSPGQYINSNTAIMSVAQLDVVRLQANIPAANMSSVEVGTPVAATFAKYPGLVANATVTSVLPIANWDGKTATVETLVRNPKHQLMPGDPITLSISVTRPTAVITVPMAAIVRKNGKSAVWTVARGDARNNQRSTRTALPVKTAHLAMVETGNTNGSRIEVLTGLQNGDEVIYKWNTLLHEGERVLATRWGPNKLPSERRSPSL